MIWIHLLSLQYMLCVYLYGTIWYGIYNSIVVALTKSLYIDVDESITWTFVIYAVTSKFVEYIKFCSCFEAIRSFLPSLGRFFLRGWSPDVFAHRGDLERSLQIINDSGGVDRVTWWEKRFGIHGSHGCQSMDSWIDWWLMHFFTWKDVSEKIRLLECGCLLCTVIKLISGRIFT